MNEDRYNEAMEKSDLDADTPNMEEAGYKKEDIKPTNFPKEEPSLSDSTLMPKNPLVH